MSESINRMQLLRGNLRGDRLSIRPPWSKPETLFVEDCSRCNDCINSCQQHIIKLGSGGYPQIDFHFGGCTFCGDCVKACKTGALAFFSEPDQPPWSLYVEIQQNCLAMNGVVCRSCGETCEESAICFQLQTGGRALPKLDLQLCNGCGECLGVCPTKSINIRPMRPEQAA